MNLKFCFEGMEETTSEGLEDYIQRAAQPGKFLDGVDCVCIVSHRCLVKCELDSNAKRSRTIIGSTLGR